MGQQRILRGFEFFTAGGNQTMNVWPRSTNHQNSNRMDCNNFELLSQPCLFFMIVGIGMNAYLNGRDSHGTHDSNGR